MAELNQETAREARDLYESMNLFMSGPFGQMLSNKLNSIKNTASDKALRGQTPDNTNVFFESRGKYAAIFEIHQMFNDISKANEDAIAWQQANVPIEDDASKKKE